MSKYSNNLKLKVVQYYSSNYASFKVVADKFNIPSCTTVKRWDKKYEEHGLEGLVKNIVEYMHNNHLSCQEVTHHFNLGSVSVVTKGERIYMRKNHKHYIKSDMVEIKI